VNTVNHAPRIAMVNCARGHVMPHGGLEVRLLTWAQHLAERGVVVSFCSLSSDAPLPTGAFSGEYQVQGEAFTRYVFAGLDDLAQHIATVDAVSVHQWPDWITHPEKTVFMIHADIATCYPYAFGELLTDRQRVLFADAAPPADHPASAFSRHALVDRMRQASVLATCSDFASASVTAATGMACRTLYSAVHDEFFESHAGEVRPVAAFVGRLTVSKGADVLLKALEAGAFDDLTLEVSDFSGDQDLAGRFEEYHHRGAPVRLHPGTTSRRELAQYMATVGVVLVPSWYEGFGTVAIEALAAGTPVVASNVGGLPEAAARVPAPTRWLVAPGDADALAAAVAAASRVRVPEFERRAIANTFGVVPSATAYLRALLDAAGGC
jgi:glycosyltransferase involved in cell wall biosynthesis